MSAATDLFERVTGEMVAAIEAGGTTWTMPWHKLANESAAVSVDGRLYRGLNAFLLPLLGRESNVWGTYRAWSSHDAQVRKGEHGAEVILWKQTKRQVRDEATGEMVERGSLYARTFRVFNAEQVDGYDVPSEVMPHDTPERIASAEAFFASVPSKVTYRGGRACFMPATDQIMMPKLERFKEAAHFYSTLAHEHGHWTGHASRLDRDAAFGNRFGSDAYAMEELVAELTSAFWCSHYGITAADRSSDHAGYLASWCKVLRESPRVLVTVMSKAQAAFDHLEGYQAAEETVAA